MTATADRFEPGRSREELRLVELASGLLMLLDAYRITGRLPLEVQVQASRLRHAIKQVIQAEAARAATPPSGGGERGPGVGAAGLDRQPAMGAAGPGRLGVPAVLPRPDHRPPPAAPGPGLPGSVRRPLLGLDRRPHPPHG